MKSSIDFSILKVAELSFYQFLVYAMSFVLGYIVSKLLGLKDDEFRVTLFISLLSNTVFVAFPLVSAIYGNTGLFYASITNIPYNILAFTIGIAIISGDKKHEYKVHAKSASGCDGFVALNTAPQYTHTGVYYAA